MCTICGTEDDVITISIKLLEDEIGSQSYCIRCLREMVTIGDQSHLDEWILEHLAA